MIILEKPYVSEFLQQTVVDLQIPVLATDFSKSLKHAQKMNLQEKEVFFNILKGTSNPLLYSNSENATELLNRFVPELEITKNVNFFKDKSKLRDIFSTLNPDMWYKKVSLEELDELDVGTLTLPFVIKPLRGFASIGIHAIHQMDEWKPAVESIKKEVILMCNIFPDVVVSLNEFIIEKCIEGTEIAIDAYYDDNGEPVILNILTHLFGSKSDMSDRLYMTSDDIIRKHHTSILVYLEEIGRMKRLRNFPFHLEMRQEENGNFVPIEINPMRFMGFCVADVEYYFYGINPYEYYFNQKKPDWNKILESRNDKIYGMFGIDIPKHLDKRKITFDYEKFISHFSKPLHYIKQDYRTLPMAIYLFAETEKKNFAEFEEILYSDLTEFIMTS
ncbi:MAG: ATP-grasp domain-containing protein [Bacteroidota bacterium]